MLLNRIDDPRDNLEKAHRLELVRFANANGLTQITEHMPAILIRRELRSRGLTNIRIPRRILGAQNQAASLPPGNGGPQPKVVEMDAAADLARQFRTEAAVPLPNGRPRRLVERPKSKINLLRDQCKELGIHMGRRDKTEDLERKIAEAANGSPSLGRTS